MIKTYAANDCLLGRKLIAISDYELSKLYPEKVEGTMPTIEELEAKVSVEDEGENSDFVNDDNKSE